MYFYEESGLKVVALLDREFKTNYAYNFLETVKSELLNRYSIDSLKNLGSNGLKEFKDVLSQQMNTFNSNYNDSLLIAKSKVLSLEKLTVENYNKLVERNTEIDDIKNQVQTLTENSTLIKGNAIKLRKSTERQYWMSYLFMIGLILVSLLGCLVHYLFDL